MDTKLEHQIQTLLTQMTLAEKVGMAAGSAMWHTTGIERLGIPAIKVTDGPNGARGGQLGGGVSTACFPVGIALAATWNTDLVEQIGVALGEEAKTKGARVLLAPTVNIHRSPLNGRNFECYSEDPYLSARVAAAYISGLQSQQISACIKHYVCNDSEFERNSINTEVGERALRELYLPPFEAAVQEANTWGVMAAYNKVNGTFAAEHPYTLLDILKGEWGFDGIVMSDWFGTKSTVAAANGGLDLEMPGPAQFMGEKLLKAVQEGEVSTEIIDDKVRRLLRVIIRTGALDDVDEKGMDPRAHAAEQAVDRPDHRTLLRRAAAEGIVVLKNADAVLPLKADALETVAVIGPNARTAQVMGGGSARVNAHYTVTPMDGIITRAGDDVELAYELGCINHKMQPPMATAQVVTQSNPSDRGFTVDYYENADFSGHPIATETAQKAEFIWFGGMPEGVNPRAFAARVSGAFTPQTSGVYTFSLVSAGLSRLAIDGTELIDNWTVQTPSDNYFGMGSAEVVGTVDLVAGQPYTITAEYTTASGGMGLSVLRIGCMPPTPVDTLARAVALARESDVALVFVGTSDEWESEGGDRADMALPLGQNELVARVAEANPYTVVVLQTGSPVTMPWLDKVAGVVQAWFPGQECGNAIADVLFGDINPSGKLTQTFPKRLADNPAFLNYPGENGKVVYGEGIFVGYRYYEKKLIEPLFPFGHGLSYTSFAYHNLRMNGHEFANADNIQVTVDVRNTGDSAGQEVVQLYVCDVASSLMRPEKELKAFAKVALEPGETQTVTLPLDMRALAYYDDAKGCWVAEAGEFRVLVGASSQDIRATVGFTLTETLQTESIRKQVVFTLETPLRDIMADERGRIILETYFGDMLDSPQMGMAMGFTLVQMAGFAPEQLTVEVLAAIGAELGAL